jgi:hypothetical protein
MFIRSFGGDLFSHQRRRGTDDDRRRRRSARLVPSLPGPSAGPLVGGSSYPNFLRSCHGCNCSTPCGVDLDCCADTPPAQMDVTLPNVFSDIAGNLCPVVTTGHGTCTSIGGKTYTLQNNTAPIHPVSNWPGGTTPIPIGWVYQIADYLAYTGDSTGHGPAVDLVLALHFRCFFSVCQWFLQLDLYSASSTAFPPSGQTWAWTVVYPTGQSAIDCNFTNGPLSMPPWSIITGANVYCNNNSGHMAWCHPDTTFHNDPIPNATITKH